MDLETKNIDSVRNKQRMIITQSKQFTAKTIQSAQLAPVSIVSVWILVASCIVPNAVTCSYLPKTHHYPKNFHSLILLKRKDLKS